jgi:hypothetical protein
MSQQPSTLQTIFQNLPNIIKSLLTLKPLFERRKAKEKQGETATETALSVQGWGEDEYVVGNVKTFRKKFKVVESPCGEANTCATITCDRRVTITLRTEDENTELLQMFGVESLEVPLEKILERLALGAVFHLESDVQIDLNKLIEQCPNSSQIAPTNWDPRDSTTLTLTNTSSSTVTDFEWPLPLRQLYPIYGFELQKGGKRISNQMIQVHLNWIETLDNQDLQELGGYEHEESILGYFGKKRKQRPRCTLSIRIDELKPGNSVTLTILHTPSPKERLGFHSGQ